jgi:hypothetical protein
VSEQVVKTVPESFDAYVWADEFCKRFPTVPHDGAVGWFANALMRGYDEHRFRSKEYKRMMRRVLNPWWKRPFIPLARYGR